MKPYRIADAGGRNLLGVVVFGRKEIRRVVYALLCMSLLLSGCAFPEFPDYCPPERERKIIGSRTYLSEFLLPIAKLPAIGEWELWGPWNVQEEWEFTGSIEATEAEYRSVPPKISIHLTLIRYESSDCAAISWRAARNEVIGGMIVRDFTLVSLLPEELAPELSAENVLYRCEDYGPSSGDFQYDCIARLQHGNLLVDVDTTIQEDGITAELFYALVQAIDEQISLQLEATAPVPTPGR